MDLGSVLAMASGAAALGAGVWKSVHLHASEYQLTVEAGSAGGLAEVGMSIGRSGDDGAVMLEPRQEDGVSRKRRVASI